MFEWISDPNAWLALTTLTFLEIILGIDNIIFLSLVVARLPAHQQNLSRRIGLAGAMIMRIALLMSFAWVMKLSYPLFYVHSWQIISASADISHLTGVFTVSARDIVLLFGGGFLVWKGTLEVKEMFNVGAHHIKQGKTLSFFRAIVEVMALDIVFSLDSVITAVGLSEHIFIMVTAIVIAVLIMMFAAKAIGDFVENNPTIKMLAIVFLVLVGTVLMVESLHIHVPKAYVYFAMFFSLTVESLNLLRARKARKYQSSNTPPSLH